MRFNLLRTAFLVPGSFAVRLTMLLTLGTAAELSAVSISITNASFENGTAGWTNDGGVFDALPPTPGMFTDPVPDGASVLYLGGKSPGSAFASQVLGTIVEANTTYTLDFWIGFRAEPFIQLTTYDVSLLPFAAAGGCGIPSPGTFIPCSLTFQSSAADVGLPLEIRIDVGDANSNAVHQFAFDDFRLSASPVPEPSQVLLVLGALAGLVASKGKRRIDS